MTENATVSTPAHPGEPLILTERIAAPRDAVFDFLVDPDKLSRWMGQVAIDPTPGGSFRLDMGDHAALGEVLAVDRPNSIAFTWGWDHVPEVPPGSTTVTISLVEEGSDTLVELRHEGLPLGPADEHRGGWTNCLERLPYAVARAALLVAERDLMLAREQVAAQRRALPPGPLVDDYMFVDTDGGEVSLTSLFTAPDRPLVLYHFMLGKQQERACPMCSLFVDGWSSVAGHLAENLDFAIVTAASAEENAALVAENGWRDLRFLSAGDNSFKVDIGGEDADGGQSPFISVYELTPDGPRLTYGGAAQLSPDHWRGVDLLSPVWHLLDLTPNGRGDWMPGGM